MAQDEIDKPVRVIDEKQLELFREFISVQKEELEIRKRDQEIRSQEIDIERQNISHAHDYAQESLKAQVVDNQNERGHRQFLATRWMCFAAFVVLLLVLLSAYGLYLNHLADLVTIIERTLALVGMAGTALFYAKWKAAEKEAKRERDEDDE
jgi:Flp pilus assembly protein TadB